jgi:hypothetical protein
VKKYIKPAYNQQLYNNRYAIGHKDRARFQKNTTTENIFPINNKYPDKTQPLGVFDEQNEHYMHYLFKRQKEFEKRADLHIRLAKDLSKKRAQHRIVSRTDVRTEDISIDDVNYGGDIEPTTGLQFGIGFDDYLRKRIKQTKEETKSDVNMDELVAKLGFLDLREFIAVNKYVLEAENHVDYVNKAKSNFLKLALSRLNEKKKEEVTNHLRKIDELNPTETAKEKENLKIEYMFNSIPESKEIFYKFYYKIKELNEKEKHILMDEFEKFNKMKESLDKKSAKGHEFDNHNYLFKNHGAYDLNDYMERIIKQYRDERTTELKLDSQALRDKIKEIEQGIKSLSEKHPIIITYEGVYLLSKFYSIFNKYKRVYYPTNLETERLIVSK